jgi:mono/diheme cytochrome c family protein
MVVAGLAAVQLVLQAQAATDPFTPLVQVFPVVLGSVYGWMSLAIVVLGVMAAVWLWRGPAVRIAAATSAAIMLAATGLATSSAADALSAAASSGEIAMSPTLAVPRTSTSTPNPYANDPQSPVRGQQVYSQYCVTCHGLNGDGNGPAVAGLRVRPPSFRNPQHFLAPGMDGAHFWVVQHGDGVPGGMPAWQGTLSDQQLWDVINYVKLLSQGQTTASSGSSRPGG